MKINFNLFIKVFSIFVIFLFLFAFAWIGEKNKISAATCTNGNNNTYQCVPYVVDQTTGQKTCGSLSQSVFNICNGANQSVCQDPCSPLGMCLVQGCTWNGGGGGSTTCSCGSQECDTTIATCSCKTNGCFTSSGAGCAKYTCGGGGGGGSCTIQGFKVKMPGNQVALPASNQTITLDGSRNTTAEPYYFSGIAASWHTVSASIPAGYSVGYTLCVNNTTCHGGTPVNSYTVTTSCPSGGYLDLWWHYTCVTPNPPTLTGIAGTSSVTFSLIPNSSDPPGTTYFVHLRNITKGTDCFNNWAGATRAWTCTGASGDQFQGTTYAQTACGNISSTYTSPIYTILSATAWWQVKDSDVITNGAIKSVIPSGNYFDLAGDGGSPGVPVYSDAVNTTLTSTNVSAKSWLANSGIVLSRAYNSSYFINLIPSAVLSDPNVKILSNSISGSYFTSGGASYNGYSWYIYDGNLNGGLPLTINSAVSLGGKKVVLIVENADLNLGSNINLTKGSGFFLTVVTGNINVNQVVGGGAVANLEGIYVTDGNFNTGTTGAKNDTKLWVRGAVASYTGINMQRDLGAAQNGANPAEFFEYGPDLELLFPHDLSSYPTKWSEVAP